MSALLPTYSSPSGRCCSSTNTVTLNQIIVLKDVTGYTGGGATNLDGIVTASVIGTVVIYVRINDNGAIYQLVSSTEATALPGIVRPLDYSASNQRVWLQVF